MIVGSKRGRKPNSLEANGQVVKTFKEEQVVGKTTGGQHDVQIMRRGSQVAFLTPAAVGEDREDADFYVNKFKDLLTSDGKVPGGTDSTWSAVGADNVGNMRNALHTLDIVFARLLCFGCVAHLLDLLCENYAKLLERVMVDATFIVVFVTSHERLRQMFLRFKSPTGIGLRTLPDTRFSYAALMLRSILEICMNLRELLDKKHDADYKEATTNKNGSRVANVQRSRHLVGNMRFKDEALATPALELDAGANVSAPMWAVEFRAAHTRVVDECGDAMLEDLAGLLACALKLRPCKRSHVARAGCSAVGAEPASAMRSEADLQAIPHYSDFILHSMRKVQEALSHRIHTVRFAKLAARMPTSSPDSNRFLGRLLRAVTAFLVTDPPNEGRLGEVRERSPKYYDSMFRVAACRPYGLAAALVLSLGEPCPCAFAPSRYKACWPVLRKLAWNSLLQLGRSRTVARCSGGDSNHAAHEWAAHGLSDVCHDVKSALGVGV
eukprot:jgi/Tetstr1/436834/TSEL_025612.t1